MSRLGIKEFFNLFCWPPCPSHIASKLAFLPPDSTYTLLNASSSQPSSHSSIHQQSPDVSVGDSRKQDESGNVDGTCHIPDRRTNGSNTNTASITNHLSHIPESDSCVEASGVNGASGDVGARAVSDSCVLDDTDHKNAVCCPQTAHDVTHKIHLSERAEWLYGAAEMDCLDVFYATTSRSNRIACMYVNCQSNVPRHSCAKRSTLPLDPSSLASSASQDHYILLFSHGNAVDLGQMSSFYYGLGQRLGCDVFSYDYSGYGDSTGRASEKNLYADAEAAWQILSKRYQVPPSRVVVYGQSIGTVPTVDLAIKHEFAGVVLHSPLMSGMRVAFNTQRTWMFDVFASIDKVPRIKSPVLVIHGTEDEVIDFSHGLAIHSKCPRPVDPLWIEGAGHNDIEIHSQYLERLHKFLTEDLKSTV